MGTPEDVAAEKYFTPPTLTSMLADSVSFTWSDGADATKKVFKEWLRTTSLPDYFTLDRDGNKFNATQSIRQLLITLVDEP